MNAVLADAVEGAVDDVDWADLDLDAVHAVAPEVLRRLGEHLT